MGENIENIGIKEAAKKGAESVKKLCLEVKMPSLTEAGCNEEDLIKLIPQMAKKAVVGISMYNPRKANEKNIKQIYLNTL
jgi:alcohol dehydrogenase class IV